MFGVPVMSFRFKLIFRFGIQVWDSSSGFRFRNQVWDAEFGIQIWDSG